MENYWNGPNNEVSKEDSASHNMEPLANIPASGKTKKRGLIIGLVSAAVSIVTFIILMALLIRGLSNTYKTPLDREIAWLNSKNHSALEMITKQANGFLENEASPFIQLLKDNDDPGDLFMSLYGACSEDEFETLEDYQFSYEIVHKEELDKSDLREFRDDLRYVGEEGTKEYEMMEDTFSSDDWREAAEDVHISKAEYKALCRAMNDVFTALENVEVTKGYELDILFSVTDLYLDETEEYDITICVYKVNGSWITEYILLGMSEESNALVEILD